MVQLEHSSATSNQYFIAN